MKGELVFKRITNIEDNFIEEADLGLDEALFRPSFTQKLGKFFASGLGVATICGVLGLGIFSTILFIGQKEPIKPPTAVTETEDSVEETVHLAETVTDVETKSEAETETETEAETEFELVTDERGGAVFAPVGNVELTASPELEKTIIFDGDLSDWQGFVYRKLTISPNNMVSHKGDGIEAAMPMDFRMTTYMALDQHWLYFAFNVVDDSFVHASGDTSFDGDAITISLDMDNMVKHYCSQDPELFPDDKLPISYTFSCSKDGEAMVFLREHTDGFNGNKSDGYISMDSEGTVQGAARKTDTGWSAEFAIKWDQLYEDGTWKCYTDRHNIYIDENQPLEIGCAVTYIDRDDADSRRIAWMATTTKGTITGTYEDCGINLIIPEDHENRIECDGIYYMCDDCGTAPSS